MSSTVKLYSIKRNREVIFIESIKELNHRIKSKNNSAYNLVRKGAILRLLIIDGSKLYNTINHDYSLKLVKKLTCSPNQGHSLSTFEDPNSGFRTIKYFVDKNGENYSIPKFLKLPAIQINNPQLKEYLDKNHVFEEYDISKIIKLIANAHGGVHFENWGDEISSFIATDASSPFNLNTNSKLHEIIDNISEIILDYLDPLGKKVYYNLKSTKPLAHEFTQTFEIQKNKKNED